MLGFMGLLSFVHRWQQSLGYGVQSPSVYYYIKYVLNEQSSYYAYDELLQPSVSLHDQSRKSYRLYLRLANFHQPYVWLDLCPQNDSVSKYIQAGCHHTSYYSVDQMDSLPQVDVARLINDDRFLYEKMLQKMTPHSVLLINNIRNDRHVFSFWNDIVEDKRIGVTIDMYSMGIAFFDGRSKQNYTIYLR